MKYILEARTVEVIQTVKEICYEITDDGFSCSFQYSPTKNHLTIRKIPVFSSNGNISTDFEFSRVKDTIFRIKDYLGKNFILMDIVSMGKHYEYRNFDDSFEFVNKSYYVKSANKWKYPENSISTLKIIWR